MYRDTVTLFNRRSLCRGNTWYYPTVLHGVDLNIDRAAIVAKLGADSQDKAILHVRYAGDGVIGDKIWLPPKEWSAQTDNLFPQTITFTPGADFDFFWAGAWDEEGAISDDMYGGLGFYDYMKNQHDYVFAVTSVSRYSVIPHFEVIGK